MEGAVGGFRAFLVMGVEGDSDGRFLADLGDVDGRGNEEGVGVRSAEPSSTDSSLEVLWSARNLRDGKEGREIEGTYHLDQIESEI